MTTQLKAVKHDKGKLRYDLIPVEPLEDLAKVFTMGAGKYGDDNWKLGLSVDRLYAAVERHLSERRKGFLRDTESGLPHTAHAMWGCMAINYFDQQADRATRLRQPDNLRLMDIPILEPPPPRPRQTWRSRVGTLSIIFFCIVYFAAAAYGGYRFFAG